MSDPAISMIAAGLSVPAAAWGAWSARHTPMRSFGRAWFWCWATIMWLAVFYTAAYAALLWGPWSQGDWSKAVIKVNPITFLAAWMVPPVLWSLEHREGKKHLSRVVRRK